MKVTYNIICGVHFGFELTEAIIESKVISYLLIDIFILRIQLAWFK